jgi:hypothetical protein
MDKRMIYAAIAAVAYFVMGMAAHGEDQPVKTCLTEVQFPGEPKRIEAEIRVYLKDGSASAIMERAAEGEKSVINEEVEIFELPVRAGMSATTDPEGLNLGEGLIVHAMTVTADPDLKDELSTGIADLIAVRSAKVYRIGEPTHLGMVALVEAKDESGKDLGTFLGGLLVKPCN